MSRSTRSIRAAALAAALAVAVAVVGAPAAGQPAPADAAPGYGRSFGTYELPPVTLVDQHGERRELESLLGGPEPVMLQFIFTSCPGVCPVLSSIFGAAQHELGDDLGRVRLVSISIDPEHDTPERLAEYAERFGATPRWRFLTGALEDVVRVQKAFDAYRGNKMRHLPSTYLRLAPDQPWLRLEGFPSGRELVAEYRRLAGS